MVMKILNQPFFCFREKEHTYESRVINTHVFIGASSGVKTHMDFGAVTEKKTESWQIGCVLKKEYTKKGFRVHCSNEFAVFFFLRLVCVISELRPEKLSLEKKYVRMCSRSKHTNFSLKWAKTQICFLLTRVMLTGLKPTTEHKVLGKLR